MPTDAPQPSFVLIRPQMGENIGAAARAMWNFGLDRMRIVAPRDGWPNPAADAMASGAGRLLDEAEVSEDVASGIADRTYVYATTARPRELTKPVFSPEAAMKDAAARIARGEKVAVMFGPERSGMENADIAHAMLSINAVKGVEIGAGFDCVAQKGTEHRDEITPDGFLSNHAGGVLGGISSGQDILASIALKPTSSIRIPGRTIDVQGQPVEVVTTGRHDPCVGIRATPIAEAMLAIVLMDHVLRHRAQNMDVHSDTPPVPPAADV